MTTPERHETAAERADRNWNDLLQELRVTQTGIQILSGFLLTLPFQQRFTGLSAPQRALFLGAVCLSTLATALIVAPVASHRLFFRTHEKTLLVTMSDRLAKAGLCALALTVITVLGLIFCVVVGASAAITATVVAGIFFALTWLALPAAVLRRQRHEEDHEEGAR